jgi:two-component system NtrC family response regulator
MNKLKTKTAMIDVLIIDDDEHICKFLSKIFKKKGYSVCYHLSLAQGLKYIFSDDSDHVSVIFLDVHLPDGDGLGAIKKIRQHPFSPEIIIITGEKDADGAELAIRSKAWDYITISESTHKFKFALDRAIEYRRHKRLSYHQAKIDREAIIGASSLISNCLNKVSQAAKGDMPVLITGETGTGKEIFARAIHDNSLYAHAKFIAVDCAALPEHLVESTLFGHVEGSGRYGF